MFSAGYDIAFDFGIIYFELLKDFIGKFRTCRFIVGFSQLIDSYKIFLVWMNKLNFEIIKQTGDIFTLHRIVSS